jgi:outer membrane immunogenic protein
VPGHSGKKAEQLSRLIETEGRCIVKKLITAAAAIAAGGFASSANAADMPARMPAKAPVMASAYNWTGWYIGANAGGAWGSTTAIDTLASNGSPWVINGGSWSAKPTGFTGALEGGYNWQFNSLVVGLEAEVGYLGVRGSANYPLLTTTFVNTKGGLFTTARARGGFAFDNILVYATGGYFGADFGSSVQTSAGAPVQLTNIGKTGFQSGWTAGGGLEYGLNRNWTVKGEYLYYAVPNKQVGDNVGASTTIQYFNIKNTGSIARVGVNYRF